MGGKKGPQPRIIMVFVMGNVPNFEYMSNMAIYLRISTLKAVRLIFCPISITNCVKILFSL